MSPWWPSTQITTTQFYVEEKKKNNIGMRFMFKQILVLRISFQIYNKHMDMKNKCIIKYRLTFFYNTQKY